MGKIGPASFRPSATTTTYTATSVLLDTEGHVADRDNATRAEALTSMGKPIAVSFFAAEPPAVSHFCVNCPSIKLSEYFVGQPRIIHSTDNLALIELSLKHDTKWNQIHREFLLYRAAGRRGRPQSLEPFPGLHRHLSKLTTGVVPCGGNNDSEHFVVAGLGLTFRSRQYDLQVFRSDNRRWTRKVVVLGKEAAIDPERVIMLGGGEIGWVDLLRGILVCNLLDDDPVLRFIPLPRLMPANAANHVSPWASQFRDVVCVDGVIKLIEIENCWRRIVRKRQIVRDISKMEVLYDQDLRLGEEVDTEKVTCYYGPFGSGRPPVVHEFSKVDVLYNEEEATYECCHGWRLLTWNRTVSSDCWRRGSLLHLHDLVFDNRRHSSVLPKLTEKDARKSFQTCYPTLSGDYGDVVYLNCKVEQENTNAWVVAVDTRRNMVLGLAPFWDQSSTYSTRLRYVACALSKYPNTV